MMAHAPSFWAASARETCQRPPLQGDIECDVAIIGGGFTGLSAAHHLDRMGRSCAVLEAQQVGWGASGRNGGNAVPRYKPTFPELEKQYGLDTALRMYRIAHEALDTLERVVGDAGLACGFSRCGLLTPMVSQADVSRFEQDAHWLRQHAGDQAPSMLGRDAVARAVGTGFYTAGYLEPRAGAIHPLEYCNSLANSLVRRGVAMYGDTCVLDWTSDGTSVRLRTAHGAVKARSLVLATNAYSDLSAAGRRLARRVVPVASAVISTGVLPEALRAGILPGGQVATDAKRLTNYYRVLQDGSFFFGGRGGASSSASQRIYDRLRRDMVTIFPQLDGIPIAHQWFGMVAVTLDSLPHIGQLESNVHYALGYNGRGVALTALLGRHLAQRIAGGAAEGLGPIETGRFDNIPFHSLRVPAKQVAITYKQVVDALGF